MIGILVDPDLIQMRMARWSSLSECEFRAPKSLFENWRRTGQNWRLPRLRLDGGDTWSEVISTFRGNTDDALQGVREIAPDLLYVV